MNKIVIVGCGGHAKSVIETIESQGLYEIVGLVGEQNQVGDHVLGYEIIGTDDLLSDVFGRGVANAFIAVGSIGNVTLRKKLVNFCENIGFQMPNVVDKTAIISPRTRMGKGNFIGKGTIVNAEATIGDYCIINTGAIVEHECQIGSFVHIAPGATLSGQVVVGSDTHIGTNATVIQNVKIGDSVLIGAGTVLTKTIASNLKIVGNPWREIQ